MDERLILVDVKHSQTKRNFEQRERHCTWAK